MHPKVEDNFNCTIGWSLKDRPHVWVISGPETALGRAVKSLEPSERWELAYQLYSVMCRGESCIYIRGTKYVICRDTFYVPVRAA